MEEGLHENKGTSHHLRWLREFADLVEVAIGELLQGALRKPEVAEAMKRWSAPIAEDKDLEVARDAMREELKKQFL